MANLTLEQTQRLKAMGYADWQIATMTDAQATRTLSGAHGNIPNTPNASQTSWTPSYYYPTANTNLYNYNVPGMPSSVSTSQLPNASNSGRDRYAELRALGFTDAQVNAIIGMGAGTTSSTSLGGGAGSNQAGGGGTSGGGTGGDGGGGGGGGGGTGGGGGGGGTGGGGASGDATDVYGGIEWKRLELEAMTQAAQLAYQYWLAQGQDAQTARNLALQAAQQRMNADMAAGYVRQGGYTAYMPGYQNPRPAAVKPVNQNAVVSDNPARADALTAIYNNRPDIKAFYDGVEQWKNKSATERMENWLGMTTEADFKGKTDAELIAISKDKGWLLTQKEKDAADSGAASGGGGGAGWYPSFFDETNKPTERQALQAIWEGNDTVRRKYKDLAEAEGWEAAMTQWKADNQIADAVQYATDNNFIEIAGPAVKTLERENAEHSWEDVDLARALEQQTQQNNFVMQYLNNLSAKKGPEDWISYWKYQRGVNDNTEVPTWLAAAQQNYNLPAWGVNYGQGQQAQSAGQVAAPNGSAWGGGTAGGAGMAQGAQGAAQQQPVGANATGGYSNQTIQNWQNALTSLKPWQMNQQQWANMLPSEQQALLGGLESSGLSAEDWNALRQRANPTGTTGQYTSWQ